MPDAVGLIGDAETIFIDEGFTPQLIAEALPTDRPLTVVTASLNTAAWLSTNTPITVLSIPSRYSFSLRVRVRRLMPSFSAALPWWPPQS